MMVPCEGGSSSVDILVLTLHLRWSNWPAEIPLEEVPGWRPNIVGYAKTAGIDLTEQDVAGLERFLKGEMDMPVIDEIPAIEKNKEAGNRDRWSYHKKFMTYSREHGTIGGSSGNILKWTRKEREEASYTGKDLLQVMEMSMKMFPFTTLIAESQQQ
ncbi:uncharacterized protein MYCFIDRAFT_208242 [Pseudocercospora fijiensis CIRAD86]|uniref:Uncharacterized protein n=1 Tax=Pseudocercospora fijiensis (strain CIRAD86) TaxID=383855 RepID=M3AV96_PSEFD|nr:uncharacterized protein MYCFIDRAFT_208242 [Pseudocercospora fijiensis CIRAD86]EME81083.1 hypothetical protein MYCFIDRAFT_208242 [Pseudocercospora fijiensis CIRAD86]